MTISPKTKKALDKILEADLKEYLVERQKPTDLLAGLEDEPSWKELLSICKELTTTSVTVKVDACVTFRPYFIGRINDVDFELDEYETYYDEEDLIAAHRKKQAAICRKLTKIVEFLAKKYEVEVHVITNRYHQLA